MLAPPAARFGDGVGSMLFTAVPVTAKPALEIVLRIHNRLFFCFYFDNQYTIRAILGYIEHLGIEKNVIVSIRQPLDFN